MRRSKWPCAQRLVSIYLKLPFSCAPCAKKLNLLVKSENDFVDRSSITRRVNGQLHTDLFLINIEFGQKTVGDDLKRKEKKKRFKIAQRKGRVSKRVMDEPEIKQLCSDGELVTNIVISRRSFSLITV